MSNVKFALTALACAFVVATPAHAAKDRGEGVCTDISFNDPNCMAYIAPSAAKPMELAPSVQSHELTAGQRCFDISYGNSSCPQYLSPSTGKTESNFGSTPRYFCSIPANPASPSC